jgi:hypothetical protein
MQRRDIAAILLRHPPESARYFLKPLPQYITSYVFWDAFMGDPSKYGAAEKLRKAL